MPTSRKPLTLTQEKKYSRRRGVSMDKLKKIQADILQGHKDKKATILYILMWRLRIY